MTAMPRPPVVADSPALVDTTVVAEIHRAIGRDALAGLVQRHLDGVARSIPLLDAWRADARWEDMRNEAHRLKGSAATLGFTGLSTLWIELETLASDASAPDVEAALARIRLVHGQLRGWAASRFGALAG